MPFYRVPIRIKVDIESSQVAAITIGLHDQNTIFDDSGIATHWIVAYTGHSACRPLLDLPNATFEEQTQCQLETRHRETGQQCRLLEAAPL